MASSRTASTTRRWTTRPLAKIAGPRLTRKAARIIAAIAEDEVAPALTAHQQLAEQILGRPAWARPRAVDARVALAELAGLLNPVFDRTGPRLRHVLAGVVAFGKRPADHSSCSFRCSLHSPSCPHPLTVTTVSVVCASWRGTLFPSRCVLRSPVWLVVVLLYQPELTGSDTLDTKASVPKIR